MAGTEAAMEEFRLLEEKRNSVLLSEIEQHRWYALAAYLGIPTEVPQGFYGEDGQWYPSAPYYPQVYPSVPVATYAPYGMDAYGQPLDPYSSPEAPPYSPVAQPTQEEEWDISALNEAGPSTPSPSEPLPSVVVDPILLQPPQPAPHFESEAIDLFPIDEPAAETSPLMPEDPISTVSEPSEASVEEIELSAEDEFFHSSSQGNAEAHIVQGEHRVVVHTLTGLVKRGVVRDLDVSDQILPLDPQTGDPVESLNTNELKAIFFMLPPGSTPLPAEGDKVRVTFNDGRQMAGYSSDYTREGLGFFLVPADNRTNTARLFIYKSGIQSVAPH